MEHTDFIAKDFPNTQRVESLDALLAQPFGPVVNAYVYPRQLTHDFNALARSVAKILEPDGLVHDMDYDALAALRTELSSETEQAALDFIIRDVDALLDLHKPGHARVRCRAVLPWPAKPELQGHPGTECFHADGEFTDPYFENILCNYTGQTTDYIASADALPDFKRDGYYVAAPSAAIHQFKLGSFWRIATRNIDATAAPLIHRAPHIVVPEEPRLLLTLVRSNRALWPAHNF